MPTGPAGSIARIVCRQPILLFAGTAALGLVACGGGGAKTNGVDAKAPAAIVAASKQAADTASSVHLSGSIVATGTPTTFDLHLVKGGGGTGTLSVGGVGFNLIRIGSTIYVKGSPAFYKQFTSSAAQLLQGKWLKGASTSGSFQAIGPFTDLSTFVDQALTTDVSQKLAKGASATVAGQKVVQVKDPKGGTLSIATNGQPYPVRISQGGSQGGSITFDHWNASVPLSAPAASVNLAQLQSGK